MDPIPTSSATQRPHVPTSSQANNCQICPCPTCLLHPALTVQPPKLMPTTASAYNSQHSPQPVPTTANTHHSQCPPQPTLTTAKELSQLYLVSVLAKSLGDPGKDTPAVSSELSPPQLVNGPLSINTGLISVPSTKDACFLSNSSVSSHQVRNTVALSVMCFMTISAHTQSVTHDGTTPPAAVCPSVLTLSQSGPHNGTTPPTAATIFCSLDKETS